MKQQQRKINCFKCKYFYTTWDQRFPRGCRAYGFKSPHIPADYVFHASGHSCMKFEEKDPNTKYSRHKQRDFQV